MTSTDVARRNGAGGTITRPETVATVDLDAIARNFRRIALLAGGREVYCVVKADAYGHGAAPVARALSSAGARRYAVASVPEAVALRRAGVVGEILVLSRADPADLPVLSGYRLTAAVHSAEDAARFADAAAGLSAPLPVHVKVDTGMGRLGVAPEELVAAAARIRRATGLALTGTLTHFASADDTVSPATGAQLRVFADALAAMRAAGIPPGLVHAANSAALLARSDALFDAVRPGIALYGVLPDERLPGAELEPALELSTSVLSVRSVPSGAALGYGGRFVTARPSRIAALPLGYHDGFRRSFSGRVGVLLEGGNAPVVGSVSMDSTLVDVTDCGARPGQRVVVIGRLAGRQVTVWDLARSADTIAYEVLCGIGPRVPRRYVLRGEG